MYNYCINKVSILSLWARYSNISDFLLFPPSEECILFAELRRSYSPTFPCLLPSFCWTTGNCRLLGKKSYKQLVLCKKLLFTFPPFPPFVFEVVWGIWEEPSTDWLGVFWKRSAYYFYIHIDNKFILKLEVKGPVGPQLLACGTLSLAPLLAPKELL